MTTTEIPQGPPRISDGDDFAKVFSYFVNVNSFGMRPDRETAKLLEAMTTDHRTLQANYVRFAAAVLVAFAEMGDEYLDPRNETAVYTARRAVQSWENGMPAIPNI